MEPLFIILKEQCCRTYAKLTTCTMLPLLSSAKLLEVAPNSLYLPRGKPERSVMVIEALDLFKRAPTSISNTY